MIHFLYFFLIFFLWWKQFHIILPLSKQTLKNLCYNWCHLTSNCVSTSMASKGKCKNSKHSWNTNLIKTLLQRVNYISIIIWQTLMIINTFPPKEVLSNFFSALCNIVSLYKYLVISSILIVRALSIDFY